MGNLRLKIMVSDPIPNHPVNEAGTSWKFLIVAESSLTALEGFFHKPHNQRNPKTYAELREWIQREVAMRVVDASDWHFEYSEFVAAEDFLPLVLDEYKVSARQAMPVAERVFRSWEWYHGLTEMEQNELLSVLGE